MDFLILLKGFNFCSILSTLPVTIHSQILMSRISECLFYFAYFFGSSKWRWRRKKKVKCRYLFNEIKYFSSLLFFSFQSRASTPSIFDTRSQGAHLKATLTFFCWMENGEKEKKTIYFHSLSYYEVSLHLLTMRLSHSSNLHFVCAQDDFLSQRLCGRKGCNRGCFREKWIF